MVSKVTSQEIAYDSSAEGEQKKVQNEIKNAKSRRCVEHLQCVKDAMTDQLDQRAFEASFETGAASWLTTLSIKQQGFHLDKQAFWDSLYLRYNIPLRRLPTQCVCSANFKIEHTLSCPKGSFITLRHNEVRDFTAELLDEVCKDIKTEPVLQELTGEQFPRSTITTPEARDDINARSFWTKGQMAFFDVKVFNPTAKVYMGQSLNAAHKSSQMNRQR